MDKFFLLFVCLFSYLPYGHNSFIHSFCFPRYLFQFFLFVCDAIISFCIQESEEREKHLKNENLFFVLPYFFKKKHDGEKNVKNQTNEKENDI